MPEKYEREIDEIIKKTGADIGPRTTLRQAFADLMRRTRENLAHQLTGALRWATPALFLVAGLLLLVVGLAIRQASLTILGVALLLLAYLFSIIRGTESFKQATGYEKNWRGQPLDTKNAAKGWRLKMRRLFGKGK